MMPKFPPAQSAVLPIESRIDLSAAQPGTGARVAGEDTRMLFAVARNALLANRAESIVFSNAADLLSILAI